MTVINQNSISGITSITAASGSVQIFNSDGSSGSLTDLAGVNVSGVVTATRYRVSAGSTAAPAITPPDDTNTGIFFPSADTIAFGEGGTEVARFDSSGRFGIGTNSPGRLLEVKSADDVLIKAVSTDPGAYVEFADNNTTQDVRLGAIGNAICFDVNSERMRIDSSGRIGIGTTSPSTTLDVSGAISLGAVALPSAGTARIFSRNTDNNLYIQTGSGSAINLLDASQNTMALFEPTSVRFFISNAEKARLDSSGRLLVGTSSNRGNWFNNSSWGGPLIQLESTSNTESAYSVTNSANNSNAPLILLGKNRSGTIGGNTVVQSDDSCGQISFFGNDGTQMVEAARIDVRVDTTPGADDMPGRLVFSTTLDGQSSPTERMKITNDGYLKATSDATYHTTGAPFHEFTATSPNYHSIILRQKNSSYNETGAGIFGIGCLRVANSGYTFAGWYSGDGSGSHFNDREFQFRGDGVAYADGSWNGGGADYAEYFEWTDANLDEEDRRGISVVLDGNKIREAVVGEDPIGVISGNPSVVGDAAWNKWNGKYLRDEFGTYIQEDYEVVNDEGETVVQQRRKLNPAYDPDQEYIPREQRPEWDCVGLMGKLRIRKGQVTGSRWIKMRDISDTVEEWLVR